MASELIDYFSGIYILFEIIPPFPSENRFPPLMLGITVRSGFFFSSNWIRNSKFRWKIYQILWKNLWCSIFSFFPLSIKIIRVNSWKYTFLTFPVNYLLMFEKKSPFSISLLLCCMIRQHILIRPVVCSWERCCVWLLSGF